MRRTGALFALACAACASPRLPEPTPPPESASAAPVVMPAPAPAPAPVVKRGRELTVDAAARDAAARVVRAVRAAVSNVDPRPVERGFAQVTTVQYRTTRRSPNAPIWVESPAMGLHHPPEPATKEEPCKQPLAVGGHVRGVRGMGAVLKAIDGAHELWIDGTRPQLAKLPRGASHGACVGPDGTRVWISWSTQATPPELFSVSLRDGTARALRSDARPQLAWLAAQKPGTHARAILVDDSEPAGWSPLARVLEAQGFDVDKKRRADAAQPGAQIVVDGRTLWLEPPDDADCAPGVVFVGTDRARIEALAERTDCDWVAGDADDRVSDAWAKLAVLARTPPAPRP